MGLAGRKFLLGATGNDKRIKAAYGQFMLLPRPGKTYKFEQTRGHWGMKRLEMLLNHFIATRSRETDKKGGTK